jgi:hypothetical protein
VSLVVQPAAAADLDEAFLWYEAQRPGWVASSSRLWSTCSRLCLKLPGATVLSTVTQGAHTSSGFPTDYSTESLVTT